MPLLGKVAGHVAAAAKRPLHTSSWHHSEAGVHCFLCSVNGDMATKMPRDPSGPLSSSQPLLAHHHELLPEEGQRRMEQTKGLCMYIMTLC